MPSKKRPEKLSYEEASKIFHYDPSTGDLIWAIDRRSRRCGDLAGCLDTQGYISVEVYRRSYRVHRIAWLLKTGAWPQSQIDHKNRNRIDNRWENLRLATPTQNAANLVRASKQGWPKGVRPQKNGQSFQAKIMRAGKYLCLGTFPTPEQAHQAYIEAAQRLHGEFARG